MEKSSIVIHNEMPSSSCMGCPFLVGGCAVPGKVCPIRDIAGRPTIRVGDLLVSLGVITKAQWEEFRDTETWTR